MQAPDEIPAQDAIPAQKVPTVERLPPTAEPVPIPRKRTFIPPKTVDMDEKNAADREEEETKPKSPHAKSYSYLQHGGALATIPRGQEKPEAVKQNGAVHRDETSPTPNVTQAPKGIRRPTVPSPQGMDPKLAERFARQRQKIAENAPSQAFQELEASQKQLRKKTSEQRDRVAVRKSLGERELTPELQQWLNKRRSKIE